MRTFLRKIRLSFIESHSARKYLIYAIGEILLVMIGILLALQVNNWNQDRIDRKKEQAIIQMLVSEMQENRNYLMRRTTRHSNIEMGSLYLLNRVGPTTESIPIDTLTHYLALVFNNTLYLPKTSNFDRFIEGEEFNLIRFDSLKILFNYYHRKLQDVANIEELANSQRRSVRQIIGEHMTKRNSVKMINLGSFYEEILFKELRQSRFEEHPEKLMTSLDFENELSVYLFLTALSHRVTDELIEEIDTVTSFAERCYSFLREK